MHVRIELCLGEWQVELNDMRHVGHVNTARSNICCHQHVSITLAKLLQRRLALPLRAIAVYLDCSGAVELLEFCAKPLGHVLLCRKDDGALTGNDQRPHDLQLVAPGASIGEHDALLNGAHRRANTADCHVCCVCRTTQIFCRHALDGLRKGCGEHEGLPLVRARQPRLFDNLADLWFEAHIEHSVCLIEDKESATRERDKSTVEKVVEPARSRHQDFHTGGKRLELWSRRRTAIRTRAPVCST
mmetsp:Transcript_31601/g.51119  ORF Transcript_31601/g.51119 Transcript_31601/m.51119 type:complete len:244 (-) Transcript_31601:389-1120(-)